MFGHMSLINSTKSSSAHGCYSPLEDGKVHLKGSYPLDSVVDVKRFSLLDSGTGVLILLKVRKFVVFPCSEN